MDSPVHFERFCLEYSAWGSKSQVISEFCFTIDIVSYIMLQCILLFHVKQNLFHLLESFVYSILLYIIPSKFLFQPLITKYSNISQLATYRNHSFNYKE